MSVAQKALAPFAHLRSIQQQYGPGSVEAYGAQQQAEQTVQRSGYTKDQDNVTVHAEKDTSDTYKTKTVPDVQRKIKSWELSMAKTQFDEWEDIPTIWIVEIENLFKKRLEDFTKSQGVELQDVVFTPIRFCKSRADAQAHYAALLAEFRNTYNIQPAAAAVAQAKVDSPAQPQKQAPSQAQNPIQSSPEMLKNPTASAQNQAPPQDPAQPQSTSEKTENTASAQTQVSNQERQDEAKKVTALSNLPMACSKSQNPTQDKIPLQAQKDTSQHPAGAHAAPKAQPLAQAPIKTKAPPQAKSQTPHSKLAFVQSTAKLNEVALAKCQVDFYNECNPEYWARMEKHFVKRIEAFAKSHGVDPRDVVINSVPLAKSQDEAQAQYKALYAMAQEEGLSKIVTEHTASEITSQKGCLTQDNLLNQIALLKMELAETKGSQDQTLKDLNAKSEKTRSEHLKKVDYLQKRIKMGQVENQLLSSKLSEEQSTSEHLRANLEESEKEVERLKKVLKAKSEQKIRVPLPSAQMLDKSAPEVKKIVPSDISQIIALNKKMADEQAKANAQRHAEILAAIQTTVQESFKDAFKAKAEEKAKAEAEEKAKIEVKAQIYAQAYVKAKTEAKAKAKAKAETEAKNRAQAKPLGCPQSSSCAKTLPDAQSQIRIKNLQKVIDQLIKSYRNSAEKYLEQIRCLEYDIQKLTEDTDYKIEDLKKEVSEKDDKILELQKELWKVIDERQEARLDAEKLAMQLCNNW
ncbi:hypothetical protein CAEBREN_17933 [Caenorhabditis brenneri]|uniref:Uncharacterized protein n=1 Tax=Caenorhabditis brenneri TaxID=135651 RepID=G0P4L5_CAEBE|nr:hypothetical protein CAEBREN_17933 [Caenorhabditis brenneri]